MKDKATRRSKRLEYLYKKSKSTKKPEDKPQTKKVDKKIKKQEKKPKQVKQVKKEKKIKEEKELEIENQNSLDLCLICDCTGSMASWINRAYQSIDKIISKVQSSFPDLKIRTSFVGYRDFSDKVQFEIIDFSYDVKDVKQKIHKIQCSGGGDACEDVQGGLDNALKLQWISNIKIAFLLCDYPAHGKKYNQGLGDYHPDKHPNNLDLDQLIRQFSERNIAFTAIKFTSYVNTMLDLMKKEYDTDTNQMIIMDYQEQVKISTEENITEKFIEQTSYIISKQISKKNDAKKNFEGKINVDDWFSFTDYLKIKKINNDGQSYEVANKTGRVWEISKDILYQMESAQNHVKEVQINKTQVCEILNQMKSEIFTIVFQKKLKKEKVIECLEKNYKEHDTSNYKELAKELLQGETCKIIGFLAKTENHFGRSTIIDVRYSFGGVRQVDHRTIQELIYNGVRYIVKSNPKKTNESLPIKEQWDKNTIEVDQFFSYTNYLKVVEVEKDIVQVQDKEGKKFHISKNIFYEEMYSAQHHGEDKKVTRTELAVVLEGAKGYIFKAKFKKQRTAKEVETILKDTKEKNMQKLFKKLANQILKGEDCVVVGHMITPNNSMGRSLVYDLNTKSLKQIDQRNIEEITFKNIRYFS